MVRRIKKKAGMNPITYKSAGVDIDAGDEAIEKIKDKVKTTFTPGVLTGIGSFGAMVDLKDLLINFRHPILVQSIDGVGTKMIVARKMNRYDTIGIDCVAMNVNDLICLGAEPVALVDYLAVDRPDERIVKEILKGLVNGALEAGVSIVGGETAVMPDLISGFDLAAMSVGVLDRGKEITGEKITVGDIILGLESSGIHSNGLTLARKALIPKFGLKKNVPELEGILGDELLKPTRIYVKPVLNAVKKCDVHGLAHITGGAFTKLRRLNPDLGFKIDMLPEPKPIFNLIKQIGNVEDREMYRTFNMGIGFCIIVSEDEVI